MNADRQQIQVISFDLDDTLWHCAPAIARGEEALYTWLQQHAPRVTATHCPLSLRSYQATIRQQFPQLQHCVTSLRLTGLRELLRMHGYPASMAEQAFEVFYRARSEVDLFDGALSMLGRLKSRYRLAAITNGNADLDLIGIGHYFDAVYAADLESAPKPEPEMFLECLNTMEIPSQALLHIGDNPETDIVGGFNAGVQTLWFNPYNAPWPESLPRPHFQARNFSEIIELFLD